MCPCCPCCSCPHPHPPHPCRPHPHYSWLHRCPCLFRALVLLSLILIGPVRGLVSPVIVVPALVVVGLVLVAVFVVLVFAALICVSNVPSCSIFLFLQRQMGNKIERESKD